MVNPAEIEAIVIIASICLVWLVSGSLGCPIGWQRDHMPLCAEALYCMVCYTPPPAQRWSPRLSIYCQGVRQYHVRCGWQQRRFILAGKQAAWEMPPNKHAACPLQMLLKQGQAGSCCELLSMCASASVARIHGQEAGLLAEVDIAWEMPANRHAACLLQTQLSDKSPQAVNKATHKSWAREFGVICLGGASTFFTIDGADEPQFWPPDELRTALTPSGAPQDATRRMSGHCSDSSMMSSPSGLCAASKPWQRCAKEQASLCLRQDKALLSHLLHTCTIPESVRPTCNVV